MHIDTNNLNCNLELQKQPLIDDIVFTYSV